MYFSTQNLTDDWPGNKDNMRSKFWHGRFWLHRGSVYNHRNRELRCEWMFGKFARSCALQLRFGEGDGDDAVQLHVGFPWLFGIYLTLTGVYRCKSVETGIAIHNNAFWIYPLSWIDESNSKDPWYRKHHAYHFPWDLNWYRTEILSHDLKSVVYVDQTKVNLGKDWFERHKIQEEAQTKESKLYSYTYTLKNGEIQKCFAKTYASKMTWRARWYPIIPIKRTGISIWADFVDENGKVTEVGEGTGSWKGGVTGTGYTLRKDETIEQCLRRMESERKFTR